MSKAEDFKVGAIVTPSAKYNSYVKEGMVSWGKTYQIIEMLQCNSDAIDCRPCKGRPIIIGDRKKREELCGWGSAWDNFIVVVNDWDF